MTTKHADDAAARGSAFTAAQAPKFPFEGLRHDHMAIKWQATWMHLGVSSGYMGLGQNTRKSSAQSPYLPRPAALGCVLPRTWQQTPRRTLRRTPSPTAENLRHHDDAAMLHKLAMVLEFVRTHTHSDGRPPTLGQSQICLQS